MRRFLGKLLDRCCRALASSRSAPVQEAVLSGLYSPFRSPSPPPFEFLDTPPFSGTSGTKESPVPPSEIRMGYGPDSDEEYLESGRKTFQSIRELADKHGSAIRGGAVLDWGCSAGRVLRHFVEAMPDGELWGVDVDDAAIRWAKAHLSPPIRFVTGTTYPHLPFEDAKFSFIYGISVFTHVEHLADAWLLELRRVLQTGGLAIFTIHDEHTAQWLDEYLRMPWVPPELDLNEIVNHDVTVVSIDSGNWRGKYTFFRDAWIEKEWGRYFNVLEIKPYVEGYQSAVVLKKE